MSANYLLRFKFFENKLERPKIFLETKNKEIIEKKKP